MKARSQLQISTERQQWKQHTLPNIYDLGTDDDTIICQIISGSEMTENNEHTKGSSSSYAVGITKNDSSDTKHSDTVLIEDPRHELLSVLGINNGEFLKNDLLPKLVLGSEDRKSVFKGRLSLFQIIPEVKIILDAGLDHENLYKQLRSFVTKERFPLQKVPAPHIDLVPHELRGLPPVSQHPVQQAWGNPSVQQQHQNQMQNNVGTSQHVQPGVIQQQAWGSNFYQYNTAPAAPQMDAASIAAALMAAQQFAPQQQQANTNSQQVYPTNFQQVYPTKIQPSFNEPGSAMMEGAITKVVARSPEIAKCFCIVNHNCYMSANTMVVCGQSWPPILGQGVKFVAYPHQQGQNQWKATWVMYDNTLLQKKGGGVINGRIQHISDRWCIVNADIFLARVIVEGCGYSWPPALGQSCSVSVIPHVQGQNKWRALNYRQL